MTTYISHLRVAEAIARTSPELDELAFAYGSLAPDSGVPMNAEETEFDPPKSLTHFMRVERGEPKIHDLAFYREYLAGVDIRSRQEYSFLFGYYVHLVTDALWELRVWEVTKRVYADQIALVGMARAVSEIKNDWYGLDFKYVHDNPNSLFWRTLAKPVPFASPLPFLSDDALNRKLDTLSQKYLQAAALEKLDRVYPYLSEERMDQFVDDTVRAVRHICRMLQNGHISADRGCIVELLPRMMVHAYSPPLGDEMVMQM